MNNPTVGFALVVILGGVLLIIAMFIGGGRYAVSDALRLSDTTGGVFVVDRFTGTTRYCSVTRGGPNCAPLSERAGAN